MSEFAATVGLVLTIATVLISLGATLQRLKHLGITITELQTELRNGLLKRLNDHSGELDVLREKSTAMKEAISAVARAAHEEAVAVREEIRKTERTVERACALRHAEKSAERA